MLVVDINLIIGPLCSNPKWAKAKGTHMSLFLSSWLSSSRHQLHEKKERGEEQETSGSMKFCPTITIKLLGGGLGLNNGLGNLVGSLAS